jgi:hypothetical protein
MVNKAVEQKDQNLGLTYVQGFLVIIIEETMELGLQCNQVSVYECVNKTTYSKIYKHSECKECMWKNQYRLHLSN